jgi:hypothetical protein
MPCRDYEPDVPRDYQKQLDRLARIACKAMTELAEQGKVDFLLLRDDEVREWWDQHQEADRKAREERELKEREERIRSEALAKLSAEEKKVLGIEYLLENKNG